MYLCPRVKYPIFLSDCNETFIFSIHFRKIHNKFHEIPSSRSRVVPSGRTDRRKDRQAERHDHTKSFFEILPTRLIKLNKYMNK
jgi:hypothetical protein